MSRVVLIEATPRTPAAAARAVRLACGGERGYTHLGFTDWRAGVLDEPLFTAAFGFDESGFTGGAVPQAAAIGFSSAIPGLVDDLAGLVWADAPVTVRALDEATGAVETRLVGAAAAGSAEAGRLTVTLSDLSRELTRPVIAGRFAGSGGLEGGSDATGRVKRRSLGAVFDVEGRLLDKAFNIHEFGDPARPLRQFVAVRDKGRDGPLVELGWQGSAAATLQALRAAAVPAGGGIGAPSIACLRWWTQASGPLCADLLGETAGGYVETAGAIAARLVAGGSTLAVDAAAAIAARPARAGLHVDGESETFGQALDRLLLPVSLLWKLDATGMVRILPIAFDAPVERLTSLRSARRAVYRPARRVIVGYQRNHRTHGDGEIAAAVDDAATAALAAAGAAADQASAASAELAIIGSDGWLSRGEKPGVVREWTALDQETMPLNLRARGAAFDGDHPELGGGGEAIYNLNSARDALNAYLGGLSPAWSDTRYDTAINPATFRGRFTDYYFARIELLTALDAAAAQTAAWDGVYGTGKDQLVAQAARAAADASAAVRELDVIASDSFLSAGEKPAVIRDWQAIADEAVPLANQAAQLGVSAAQVGAARDALAAYLNSLSPGWADTSQDTAIVAATFRGRWTDYYHARTLLINAMADAAARTASWDGVYGTGKDQLVAQAARAAADASAAVRELNVIASDSFLSAGEKPAIIRDWQAIANEAVPLANQAAQLGVSAAQVGAARDALAAYLNSLSPGWADTSQDTAIVAATFAGRWTDYYYARALLLNAMAQAASQAVPTVNRVRLSLFEKGTKGWAPRYNPAGLTRDLASDVFPPTGTRYFNCRYFATAAGQVASIGTGPGYDVTVTPGEYLWVQAGIQAVRDDPSPANQALRAATLVIGFLAADGSALPQQPIWSGTVAAAFAAVACAAPIQVPAGAARAYLELYGTSADGNAFVLGLTQPMIAACSRAQTAALAFVAGPNADDGADVTGDNTAGDTAKVAGVSAADLTNLVASTTATANAVQSFTADVADNNRASPDEKKRYAGAVAGWDADVAAEVQRASAAGLGAEGAAYQTAYAAFRSFLVDTVRINDLSTRTYFDRGRFVALSSAFTAAATALANAIKSRVQLLNAAGRATTATVNATSVVAGIKTLNLTGFALSQAKSGSTVTVAATASRYRLDTGVVIDYPSASFPGLAFSTAYYVWRDDPDLDGGSGYGISTDLQDASAPGRIYLGYIVTMSSAGTGGSGGGGGTSNCVDPEMWVEIEGEGAVRAGDVVEGQRILCLTEDWAGTEYVEVTGSARYDNIKARITTASGEVWDGAINTPVPRRAGDYVAAGNAAGAEVPVGGAGEVAWSVAAVTPIGIGPVQRISCRERVFGAGRDPGRLVFTHNAAQKP